MKINYNIFQNNSILFRKYVLDVMLKSPEYSGIEYKFDSILLLADRVLGTFIEHFEFSQIEKIATYLNDIAQSEEHQEDNSNSVDALLQASEQWLKPILWLVFPSNWTKLNQNKKLFTLFPTIRELYLLTQAELDTPEREAHKITDEIRQLIYWNRKDRNYITHETHDAPVYIRGRFLTVALVTLLAPIYKHQDLIKDKLLGLISSPLPTKDIEDLLVLVNSERLKHLERFCARGKWIGDLHRRLSEPSQVSKPYLLLIGYEGIGKSAICAKLTEEISPIHSVYGRYAGGVKKVAPWLPYTLLHFGKQSNQPYEIIRSLIAQANTLLLSPTSVPETNDYVGPEVESEPLRNDVTTMMDIKGSRGRTRSRADFRNTSGIYSRQKLEGMVQTRHKAAISDLTQYRRALHLTLEKVTQERGPIVLIIDAVDEVSASGIDLEFLPERLPNGVSALLTGRHNTKAIEWLINNREVDRIRLTGLEKDEIPLLTQINSLDGEAEANFNERVLKASQGWPVLVLSAARTAQRNRDNLDAVQVDRSVDRVFERQASEWEIDSPHSITGLLSDLLLLLAVFEPVAPLELGLIQSFLDFRNIKLSLADLRQELRLVGAQLEGLEIGRIKLGLKAFAEYVRERYCSKKDLMGILEVVVDWLSIEYDVDPKILSAFLRFWMDTDQVRDNKIQGMVEKLVDSLVNRKQSSLLYDIYLLSQQKKLKKGTLFAFASRFLFSAAELEDTRAMFSLGWRLVEGTGVHKNIPEGERWIRRAAEANHAPAVIYLALHLLDGEGVEKKPEEGEVLLRQAADSGDIRGMRILASRLIDGRGVQKDSEEGERLLRRLADDGDSRSIRDLGIRLVMGLGLTKNPEEGDQLFRRLAKEGDSEAATILANFLLDGVRLPQSTEEGESLLRNAASVGNTDAIGILADRLLDGKGLPQNIEEGEKLLRRLADDGHNRAMEVLGNRLIDGISVPMNVQEGTQWLIRAGDSDYTQAWVTLGARMIDGDGLAQNKKEGIRWLRKAAEMGDTRAMGILSGYLLDDEGLFRNTKEGERWLRNAAASNNVEAMIILGNRLLSGTGLSIDIQEGEKWLRKAAETGDPEAMTNLGDRLFNGEGLSQDRREGLTLLDKALSMGYGYAGVSIGLSYYNSRDFPKAAEYFFQAFQLGERYGGSNLVYMARRSELPASFAIPPVPDLLAQVLDDRDIFGIINYALCLAVGFHYKQDWFAADQAIASLASSTGRPITDLLDWWYEKLTKQNDPEGDLVIGWLVRHQFIKDPDGISIAKRMAKARAHGWAVPVWMDQKI